MNSQLRVGGHMSIAGGLGKSIERLLQIGGNCLQIFSHPPQRWKTPTYSEEQLSDFKQQLILHDIRPVFIHSSYLLNFASDSQQTVDFSVQSLIQDLNFCHAIGGQGVIFHFGSHPAGFSGKRKELVTIIHNVLEHSPHDTQCIIENCAGEGTKIGSTLPELSDMLQSFNHDRIRLCFDTAHLFSSGYDISTKSGVQTLTDQVQTYVSWEKVSAIHLNDSQTPLGNKVDRHANIGEGCIGSNGLSAFVTEPVISRLPFILETPGENRSGPDQVNIDRVKYFVS